MQSIQFHHLHHQNKELSITIIQTIKIVNTHEHLQHCTFILTSIITAKTWQCCEEVIWTRLLLRSIITSTHKSNINKNNLTNMIIDSQPKIRQLQSRDIIIIIRLVCRHFIYHHHINALTSIETKQLSKYCWCVSNRMELMQTRLKYGSISRELLNEI